MVSSSAFAVATGAALVSLAVASPVCRVVVTVDYGTPTWKPDGGHPKPYPSATWGDWSNWENKPVPTTSLSETWLNPKPTGKPTGTWGNWNGHQASTTTSEDPHSATTTPGTKPWAPWITVTTTAGNNGTSTTTTSSSSSSSDGTVSTTTTTTTATTSDDTTVTTPPTTTTTTTTSDSSSTTTSTTSETSSTTTGACPAPTESFYLQGVETDNPLVNGNYASLVRQDNTTNNYIAFNQADTTGATVFNFNADCQLTSGPRVFLVLDEPGQFEPVHYQYLNIPGEETVGYDYAINTCAVDENNIVTCTVKGQNLFQVRERTDLLIIGDQLYYPAFTMARVPIPSV